MIDSFNFTLTPGKSSSPADKSDATSDTQSTPKTRTGRCLSMLGSAVGTVAKTALKTAGTAAWVVPTALLASYLVPNSVFNATASAASSAISQIPSNAFTSHLSTAASYAVNHLPSYDTAVKLSAAAMAYTIGTAGYMAYRQGSPSSRYDTYRTGFQQGQKADPSLPEGTISYSYQRDPSGDTETFDPKLRQQTSKMEEEPELDEWAPEIQYDWQGGRNEAQGSRDWSSEGTGEWGARSGSQDNSRK